MDMKNKFSVLDLSPVVSGQAPREALESTLDLARRIDELNFKRYWVAEHHGMRGIATSSPEVVMSHLAMNTKKLRIGSGGIMLPNHAPLKVAENFKTLEAFHPGRIDLGIGRAPGTDSRTALALRGSEKALRADDFPERLIDLMQYLGSEELDRVLAMPTIDTFPEIWLLGSSDFSARLSAQLGLPFSFADHFSHLPAKPIVDMYRSLFRPSKFLKEPKVMLGAHVICADTQEEANRLALSSDHTFFELRQKGMSVPLESPEKCRELGFNREGVRGLSDMGPKKFVGSLATLQEIFVPYLEEIEPDEVIITSFIYDKEARYRSYELLNQL
jgi:luciferase family oxidoreductase group 1